MKIFNKGNRAEGLRVQEEFASQFEERMKNLNFNYNYNMKCEAADLIGTAASIFTSGAHCFILARLFNTTGSI